MDNLAATFRSAGDAEDCVWAAAAAPVQVEQQQSAGTLALTSPQRLKWTQG